MFDIGWTELVVIGVVALIVIGPKELPGVLRMLGQWMGKVRRMAADFQGQFHEAMREAEMADLKKHVDEIADSARDLTSDFDPIGSLDVDDPFDERGDTAKAGKRKAAGEVGADADPGAVSLSQDAPSTEPAQAGPQAEPTSTADTPPSPPPRDGGGNADEPPPPQKAAAGGHSG